MHGQQIEMNGCWAEKMRVIIKGVNMGKIQQ